LLAQFDELRKEVDAREKAVLNRLTLIARRKRMALTKQMSELADSLEEYEMVNEMSSFILSEADNAANQNYVVGMTGITCSHQDYNPFSHPSTHSFAC